MRWSKCDACQAMVTHYLIAACASVGIEHGRSTDEEVLLYLAARHEAEDHDGQNSRRTPRQRWGTCCPSDPECSHSYLDAAALTRWMDTPITDAEAAVRSGSSGGVT